jgi:hypothetical protein
MDELTYEECKELKRVVRTAMNQRAMDPVLAVKLFDALHKRVWTINPRAIETGDNL